MKRSKFSDSQIMDAVKRVEAGIGVPDICRELGVSSATFYKWRAKYGGMDVSMISRMKQFEEEKRRLEKICLRKFPHQVENSKLEIPVLNVLGMNSMGVLSPRESWGLNSL